MLSKALLVSLFTAVVVAAPAPSIRDLRPRPYADVPCTNGNPAPSSSVILLNSPTDLGRIAGQQGPGSPPVINLNQPTAPSPSVIDLNAPGASPSIINLKRRQLSSLPPTSTFSFGGIVPSSTISSTPLPSSGTPAASSSPSFSLGGIVASSSSSSPSAAAAAATPASAASNSTSTFSSTGPDGVKTVLLLSTVTVSGAACSSAPALIPASGVVASSSALPASLPLSSSSNPPAVGANIQPSSPSIINLNSPSATITSAVGFSFGSAPAANATPAV